MMNHDNSVMGPSLQTQKLICVASNKATLAFRRSNALHPKKIAKLIAVGSTIAGGDQTNSSRSGNRLHHDRLQSGDLPVGQHRKDV